MGVKKSFIRSLEAVFAIVLFLAFYNIATLSLFSERAKSSTDDAAITLLDALSKTSVLNELVLNYDLTALSNYIYYLFPPNAGFKLELLYSEPVLITNNLAGNIDANVSIFRVLPVSANLNSISVVDNLNNNMQVYVLDNYYETIITVQANKSLNNETILLEDVRLTVDSAGVLNESSVTGYAGITESLVTMSSFTYDDNYYNATADVTILIPRAEIGDIIYVYLFYADGIAYDSKTYPALMPGIVMPFQTSTPVKSRACQVITKVSLNSGETKLLILSYELNTNTINTYEQLVRNDNGIEKEYTNNYYRGTPALSNYEAARTSTVNKIVAGREKNALVKMKVWYYE